MAFFLPRREEWKHSGSDVLTAEKRSIDRAREAESLEGTSDYTGVTLSGGGIRSAAFGMGVLQAMVRHDRLQQVDYLSTVSGGGYVGSSLSWWISQGHGTRGDNFPLGVRPGTAGGQTFSDRNLNYIRQHAEYLTPGKGLNAMSLIGAVFRSLFSALLAYLPLIGLFIGFLFTFAPALWEQFDLPGTLSQRYPFIVAIILLYLLVLGAIVHSFALASPRFGRRWSYQLSVWSQRQLGRSWTFLVVMLLLGTLPVVYGFLRSAMGTVNPLTAAGVDSSAVVAMVDTISTDTAGGFREAAKNVGIDLSQVGGVIAAIGTVLTLVLRILQTMEFKAEDRKGWKGGLVKVIAATVIYGLILGAYAISQVFAVRYTDFDDLKAIYLWGWVSVIGLYASQINLNQVGHHRMYRDRLMELFMADRPAVEKNEWARATEADESPLYSYGRIHGDNGGHDGDRSYVQRPYHIINTNVVLVDSANPRYRARGGDSFILSPEFVGSDATQWCRTKDFKVDGDRGITLPSAMAISGAALNPNTGASGRGPTRSRLVSALMTLLNLRLGYWVVGPYGFRMTPNYIFPGIYSLLGFGFHEKAQHLELTDGGHFDNLGLYELIRRRVKTIIVSDAACDPDFKFSDLASVIERVRTDFGVIIWFSESMDENLDGLVPSRDGESHQTSGVRLADRGYAVATIYYPKVSDDENDPANAPGRLIYIKSTLIDGLPLDVYDYKRNHPTFPDETTADQFFDERQFEAYRELGYYIGREAVATCWPVEESASQRGAAT